MEAQHSPWRETGNHPPISRETVLSFQGLLQRDHLMVTQMLGLGSLGRGKRGWELRVFLASCFSGLDEPQGMLAECGKVP